ncbi:MAG: hypothetical protein EZS28_029033 [Streblomastix strix]|uniref:Uncharacterized protein n=1 Tax=Streblomastix strix TaxID=222440 RepID=A0A5J4UYD9_9EUKA|nr:MAG: hypothetical protein EZS28_029033 [Streblomastix strix]
MQPKQVSDVYATSIKAVSFAEIALLAEINYFFQVQSRLKFFIDAYLVCRTAGILLKTIWLLKFELEFNSQYALINRRKPQKFSPAHQNTPNCRNSSNPRERKYRKPNKNHQAKNSREIQEQNQQQAVSSEESVNSENNGTDITLEKYDLLTDNDIDLFE